MSSNGFWSRLWRKVVPGLTCSVMFVGVAELVSALLSRWEIGQFIGFGLPGMIRVGLPAFFGGLLFFPVDKDALKSRDLFTLRGLIAGIVYSMVHRILLWGPGCHRLDADTSVMTLLSDAFSTLFTYLAHPYVSLFHPVATAPHIFGIEGPMLMELLGVLFSGAVAYAIHPTLSAAVGLRSRSLGTGTGMTDSSMSQGFAFASVTSSDRATRKSLRAR
jgi:hypothetical protein